MFRNLAIPLLLGCLVAANLRSQQVQPAQPAAPAAKSGITLGSDLLPEPAEDWSKLPVDRTVLKPLIPGVQLGKLDAPQYTRELIRLEWRHGDPIDLYVIKPASVPRPHPVLFLYSYPSDAERFMNDGWCRRATQQGIAAVGFVSALTGDRFRNRPFKQWFVAELQESMGSSVHDVQLILDYLASRGDLSMDRVGMWGQGSGASIAILAAAADLRIKVLDLLNPWGDWPEWLKSSPVVPDGERASYLSDDFLRRVAAVEPATYLPQLKDRTVRVQQIMTDTDTPQAARDRIAAAVPAGDLVQYKDEEAHRAAWRMGGVSAWISTQIQVPQHAAPAGAVSAVPKQTP